MRLIDRLLLALWAGMLVTIGAVVAPTLFQVLPDRHLAGITAGALFRTATLISVALSGALALLATRLPPGRPLFGRMASVLIPAAALAASEWLVRPVLEAARADAGTGSHAFLVWHGVSTLLYGFASVWVVALLVRDLRR